MRVLHYFFYEGYETLDIMGPIEMLGTLNENGEYFDVHYVSVEGGLIKSFQNFEIMTEALADVPAPDIIVIPGGRASEEVAQSAGFMEALTPALEHAEFVLTICTGSLMVARSGLIDGLPSTTNKFVFDWVVGDYPAVDWQRSARWVHAGKFYMSSGVSAGTDMALAFVADQYGEDRAEYLVQMTEYIWSKDPADDPFAKE